MNVTPAESRIMDALWSRQPLTVEEIAEAVAEPNGWGLATVKTLIQRLLKRGAIQANRLDGRVRYGPTIQRSDYVQAETQGLLDRLFDGRLSPLVAHFAQHRRLSSEEVRRLKALIESLEDGR